MSSRNNDSKSIYNEYLQLEGKKPYSPLDGDRPKEGTPEGEEYETRHIIPGPERERELKRRKEAREKKPKEEGMGQPDDFTGAEPDHLSDPDEVNDGSQRNDFWREKVTKAVEDIDDEDFLRKVIEHIWVMREEEGIEGPEAIERDDDYRGEDDDHRGETDQEKYGYPGDR